MSREIRNRRHERQTFGGERGQALIEFALVLPLVLLLVFGVIDVGRAVNYWNDTTHMANEAARYAAVNNCPGCGAQTINDYVKNQAGSDELKSGGGSIATPGVSVCIFFPNAGGTLPATVAVGEPVGVVVSAKYNWLQFLLSKFGSAQSTLTGKSTMRLEQAYDSTNGTAKYTASASCP
jgi:Flp pilus assembly protein TadG